MDEMVAPPAAVIPLRHHPAVAAALGALPPLHDPMWPIAAAGVGDTVTAGLADPARLVDAADRLAAVARANSCDSIKGASALGDTLAGAVASRHSLRLYDATSAASRVLIVDGVLATGAALCLAVDEVAAAGYPDPTLAVLVDLGATSATAAGRRVIEA
jgi:adenine/guanine phosphoribosyltransferase-like PRPP-binding protein